MYRMKRLTFIVLFLVTAFQLVSAQQALTILNNQNGLPLQGASIQHLDSDAVYITDSLGTAWLQNLEGRYRISYMGFENKTVQVVSKAGSKTVGLDPDLQFLREVEVYGHENNSAYLTIAGSYNIINKQTIENYSQESLVRAVNTIPGVRMEERSPASYRLSIRGSLLRAPFGVRNVKVYWNDIPFTDPTGNTFLYFLDNSNVDGIELIKGPAGSVYGAGMGGVMRLKSKHQQDEEGIRSSVGVSMGSFGLRKLDLATGYQKEEFRTTLRYSGLATNGYRDHTEVKRNVFQSQTEISNTENNTLFLNILYSDLYYQLPGGLTRLEYDENPKQARQIAIDRKSSIKHENILVGMGNRHNWGDKLSNTTSVYYTNGAKENPFISNYELERTTGIGGRTKFVKISQFAGNTLYQTAGLEAQYGKFHANNHGNDGGYADTLRYEDESVFYQGFAFVQAEYFSKSNWGVTIGASINYTRYHIERLQDVALDSSYSFTRNFKPIIIPRVGVVKQLNAHTSLHASISEGFSPPSQDEIRTSDGEINRDITAERGFNYEAGYRGNTANGVLMFDVTAFFMQQKNTIVSRIGENGISAFENAGSTDQKGIEALVAFQPIDNPEKLLSSLRIQTAYTYHHFKFNDYQKEGGDENVDYSGNRLTGTAPHILVSSLDCQFNFGGYLFVSHNFTDEIPLNDANSVHASGYHLVGGKVGWRGGGNTKLNIFAGADNLLNKKYSLGNDLNAFGGRFFEPSPPRNYYVGIKLEF